MSSKLTPEQIALLKNTKSIEDWNSACNSIKEAHGGNYPSDWWPEVMSSGLANSVMASWPEPGSAEITATSLELGDLGESYPVESNLPNDQSSALNELMKLLLGGGGPMGSSGPSLTAPVDPSVPTTYPSNEKEFVLGDILSVTLGFLFDAYRGMTAPHGVMHFMMGGGPPLSEIEMQTFVLAVTEAIYQQHPALREVEKDLPSLLELAKKRASTNTTEPWLRQQEAKYGEKLTLKFST